MKIPDKIKIGGLMYNVAETPQLTREGMGLGNSCGNSLIINIDALQPQQSKEQTFLHEILEQINFQYELKLEHHVISVLEATLYQVLKDNHLLSEEV